MMNAIHIFISIFKLCQGINVLLNPDIEGGYTSTGMIQYTEPTNITRCAVECMIDPSCKMVAHDAVGLRCFTYDTLITANTSLVASFTSDFYILTVCPRYDYTYNETLGVCVKIFSDYKTYSDAKRTCQDDNGKLFIVNSEARFKFFMDIIGNAKFWAGGTKNPNKPDEWRWDNGDIITAVNGGAYWLPGKPKDNNGSDCMVMKYSEGRGMYGFQNLPATLTKRFACEMYT